MVVVVVLGMVVVVEVVDDVVVVLAGSIVKSTVPKHLLAVVVVMHTPNASTPRGSVSEYCILSSPASTVPVIVPLGLSITPGGRLESPVAISSENV
jgi:hypothetical protein